MVASWVKQVGAVLVCVLVVFAGVFSVIESNKRKGKHSGDVEGYCTVVGTRFAWVVQMGLLVIAVSVLWLKRWKEVPRRPWKVFLMDAAKQGVSSGAAHMCGMVSTLILSHATAERLECGWYIMAFTLDTTFGVYVAYRLLRLLEREALSRSWPSLTSSGCYKSPTRDHDPTADPDTTVWLKQLTTFTLIVILARMASITLLTSLLFPLDPVVVGVCGMFKGHPKLFLVVVMVIGPGLLNIMQWWVQDNFLKKQPHTPIIDESECDDLLGDPSGSGSFDTSFAMNDALEISDIENGEY
eukprot:TRINITY_DN16865_c0_g1_i1.p1 TRINITY_DN16865_c0_g1~~TRINITY_DN16865_c0_g1_i1.p1  ORF type:complete len:298 (+),score=74.97 TRINITY_DN16865_c0_g1_i1:49-942(+)